MKVANIAKSFVEGERRLAILDALSLEIGPGEIVAIVGASGSGKSTLLSLLAGFDRPDHGEITWDGQSTLGLDDDAWADLRRRRLGFVFQNYHLIPYLTARENVALPLRLLKHEHAEARAAEVLAEFKLQDRLDHLPRQLSGGECQRVAIARALIHRPDLILADEPTGSLDVHTGELVLNLFFTQLRGRRQSALIVTHAADVAARCDRTLTLREGRLWS